jgi:hypothetical protein
MKALIPALTALLALAPGLAPAEAFKPYQVLALSGTASLTRFENETWPLEAGQFLPGDFSLALEKGAFIHLRAQKRVDIAVSGPAQLKSFALETQSGELADHDLVLRIERGEFYFDTRFLLKRPSQIRLDLPDANFELQSGSITALSADPSRATVYSTQDPALLELDAEPVPVLVLGRDYDKELKAWARPSILGPAMAAALENVAGLELVDGSGSTLLAAFANNAIKTGQDFFLQKLARERGARFVVVGNLVSDEIRDDNLRRTALMSGVAEVRVLEAHENGDVLVSDTATTTMARAGRSLEIVGPQVMRLAAARAARYLADDMEGLLRGEPHPSRLAKISFNNAREDWVRELRQGLGSLPSLQRFFKRGYASGVFRVDVILRKPDAEFLAQLKALDFKKFTLEQESSPEEGAWVFTLRKGPEPTPTPTPKRPLDWRK